MLAGWAPALRRTAKSAAPRPGHEKTNGLLVSHPRRARSPRVPDATRHEVTRRRAGTHLDLRKIGPNSKSLRRVRGTETIGPRQMSAPYFVYILASGRNGTLYIGVTNDLARRLAEHKGKFVPGFTRKYQVDQLVYFEAFESILEARAREHSMKRWRRAWKIALIEKLNPGWRDLTDDLSF
jgi:putative endonuclease